MSPSREPGLRLLVCGGRDYVNSAEMTEILDRFATVVRVSVLIEGEAPGADTLAAAWAFAKGIPIVRYPAEWRRHGSAAGVLRNARMLDEGRPDLILAFPTIASRGTWDMVSRGRKARIPVWVMPGDASKIDALGEGVFA